MYNNEEEDGFFGGNLNEDLSRFESFLKGSPIGFLDSDRWEALMDHFLISAQYSKALTCSEEALNQFSFRPLFKLRKAQALSALGELKEAVNLLSEIEREGMNSMETLLTKASVFSQLKDSKNAIKYFKASLDAASPEDRDEIYLDLAVEYENDGNYKLAINVLEEAVTVNPKNEGAVCELAFCYDFLGQTEKSIECYLTFIDSNPYSFTGWYNLGNAYTKMRNYEKALWAYDYCVLINNDFGPAFFNLGHTYLSLNKYRQAIECFDKSMELDGDDSLAMCYIGECHEQLNQLELAKHYYKGALELTPMLPDAWLGLGIVEDLEGNTREGLVLIQKAHELDETNASICHVLAGAYEKLVSYEQAGEYYQKSLELDPNDAECLLNYVNLLSDNSFKEAFDFLDENRDLFTGNDIALLLEVSLLWKLGNTQEALNLFKECLVIDKNKALELFEINPALKSVTEFVLLADQ